MSFRCQSCTEHVKTAPQMVVTKKRDKEYPSRHTGHRDGRGWEIVEEKRVCSVCAVKMKFNGPETVLPPAATSAPVAAPTIADVAAA